MKQITIGKIMKKLLIMSGMVLGSLSSMACSVDTQHGHHFSFDGRIVMLAVGIGIGIGCGYFLRKKTEKGTCEK